jgi:hypothetical protein
MVPLAADPVTACMVPVAVPWLVAQTVWLPELMLFDMLLKVNEKDPALAPPIATHSLLLVVTAMLEPETELAAVYVASVGWPAMVIPKMKFEKPVGELESAMPMDPRPLLLS